MNISGIQSYSGLYDYNSIEKNEPLLPKVQSQPVENTKAEQTVPEQPGQNDSEAAAAKQTYTSADYASLYQADVAYDLKGADSDIYNLDMTKAISDLQKDQVLQQYQFFVGESRAQGNTVSAAGNLSAFRAEEDFSL